MKGSEEDNAGRVECVDECRQRFLTGLQKQS